jgi:hypothetical protein
MSLQTPLEVHRRKLNDADRRRSAALLAGRTVNPTVTPSDSPANLSEATTPSSVDETPVPRARAEGIEKSGTQIGSPLAKAPNAKHLPDALVEEVLEVTAWAMRGSNPRPRACEARAGR